MARAVKIDRRIARTRNALREALIHLMLERGWDGFGIQELCERADVGRSTFYVHFADKEELVRAAFDDLRDAFRAQSRAATATEGDRFSSLRGLVEHAHEHRKLFLAVVGKKSGLVVQRLFRELVFRVVREELTADLSPGVRRDVLNAFLGGALLETMTWSLESKSNVSADETLAHFRRLAEPVLSG